MENGRSATAATITRAATLGLQLAAALACSESSSGRGPIQSAGTGGTSPGANEAGSAGQPGSLDDAGSSPGGTASDTDSGTPDAGSPPFQAFLDGQTVRLRALANVWLTGCGESLLVVKRVGDGWVPLLDERPDGGNFQHSAHYLDGAYHPNCRLTLGCDVGYCVPFSGSDIDWGSDQDAEWNNWPLSAREYVRVGNIDALTCDTLDAGVPPDAAIDAGLQRVPAIESRSPTGPLGVQIRYYPDNPCQAAASIDPITALVPVQ